MELLIIPAVLWSLGCFFLPLWAAYDLWNDFEHGMAIAVSCIAWPIGILMACAPWALMADSKDPKLHLNKTEWICMDSHTIPITTYVKSGSVMVPITTYHRVCDEYRRK